MRFVFVLCVLATRATAEPPRVTAAAHVGTASTMMYGYSDDDIGGRGLYLDADLGVRWRDVSACAWFARSTFHDPNISELMSHFDERHVMYDVGVRVHAHLGDYVFLGAGIARERDDVDGIAYIDYPPPERDVYTSSVTRTLVELEAGIAGPRLGPLAPEATIAWARIPDIYNRYIESVRFAIGVAY